MTLKELSEEYLILSEVMLYMQSEQNRNNILRIIIAILLLLLCAFGIYYILSRLYYDYTHDWSVSFINAAHSVYERGEDTNRLPEHSFDGFPKFFYVLTLIIGITIFLLLRVCLKRKTLYSVVCALIVFAYMVTVISVAGMEYYKQDYRKNVGYAYQLHYNRWWQEDHQTNAAEPVIQSILKDNSEL